MSAHGNPVLVDSCFYITLLRSRIDPLERLERHRIEFDYDFATCGIIWMEVLRGRTEASVRDRYNRFFQTAIFLNPGPAAWERVARLTWELERKGEILPATDLVIAACALEHDIPVLTFDRHFQKIPGLVAVDYLP